MMKTILSTFLFFSCLSAPAQQPIDVTDQTLRIGGKKSEELYLGFAAGDRIIFNFSEAGGRELKEIEILEYPSHSRFSEYKSSKIENKTIQVNRTGVYQFRFQNGALGGRVCRIQVQRIPATEAMAAFSTEVQWVEKQDTTWNSYTRPVVVGYDTVYMQATRRELVETLVNEELVFDKTQRVHSQTNGNGNRTSVYFTLPPHQDGRDRTVRVIGWAYWVGVGQEAAEAWKANLRQLSSSSAGLLVKSLRVTSPLGALAAGALPSLITPTVGEDVFYALTDMDNRNLFLREQPFRRHDDGKGPAGYHRFTDPRICQGSYFLCLSNDNIMQGIDVQVKVSAVLETKIYEEKPLTEMRVTPRYEQRIFRDPVISRSRVPLAGR